VQFGPFQPAQQKQPKAETHTISDFELPFWFDFLNSLSKKDTKLLLNTLSGLSFVSAFCNRACDFFDANV
jgi:hypothetical protein